MPNEETLIDDETGLPVEDVEAKLAAATAAHQEKHPNAAKARAAKLAKQATKGVAMPSPMVDPAKLSGKTAPVLRPVLQVTDTSTLGDGFTDDERPEPIMAPKPRKKAAAPKRQDRVYSPEQQAILDNIMAESEARIDMDEFLATRDKDMFHVPAHLIPDGFDVQWKTTSVNGKEVDGTYNEAVASAGWRPAPAELFKTQGSETGLIPESYDDPYIRRGGQMLFIRPMKYSEAIKEAEYQAAIGQVSDKMASLTQTPAKENPRFVKAFSRGEYEGRRLPIMADK